MIFLFGESSKSTSVYDEWMDVTWNESNENQSMDCLDNKVFFIDWILSTTKQKNQFKLTEWIIIMQPHLIKFSNNVKN